MKSIIVLFFIFFSIKCFSQVSIDSSFALYTSQSPQEKLYLHTDRENYVQGETIWFKAYLLADGLPTTVSTNLYTDLLDNNGKIIEHKTMPIFNGTTDGYFTLPDSITSNHYNIRAYTTWMLNFDTAFIYYKKINTLFDAAVSNSEKLKTSVQFFAEGGNCLANVYNQIAFKATYSNALPYNIVGTIKNSKGIFIDSFASIHNGMGMVKFTPEPGENYFADWKDNNNEYRRTALPSVQASGAVLHVEQVNNELFYLINISNNTDNLNELHILASINQQPVYNATINLKGQTSINKKFSTKDLPTGILLFTIFDKNKQPLAERIVFIDNRNYDFKAAINVTEKSISKRAKNTIEIKVADTLNTNLSLSIYDDDLSKTGSNPNIYTSLLLTSDIKGYVHNANEYFNTITTNNNKWLDLVMQTNGWRRYNWDRITANLPPVISFQNDNYLSIYGKASDGSQKGKAAEIINLIVQSKDSTKQWYMPITDKEGLFTQSGLIFYDTATIFYKVNNSKDKTTGIGLAKNYNGLSTTKLANYVPYYFNIGVDSMIENANIKKYATNLKNNNPNFEKNVKLLNEVVVKGKKKWRNIKREELEKMDEKYTNIFRGIGAATVWAFDVANDKMTVAKFDIYNYMIGRVPGLSIKYSNGVVGKKFIFRCPNPLLDCANATALVFVNESEVDYDYLDLIDLDNIAYVKFYEQVAWRQGYPPAINIYLKKGDDLNKTQKNIPSNLSKTSIVGYSPIKEFYAPDYSIPNTNQGSSDVRSTLLWQPYILTDKNNLTVPITFYNNDFSKKLRIVLEGINEEGKLIHIEKVIE
jgi:hypothetical protein